MNQRQTFSTTFLNREDDQTTVIPFTTGASAKAQMRSKPGDPTLLAEFTTSVNAPAGSVTIALTDEQTDALPIGMVEYDVMIVNTDGTQYVFIEGKIRVDGTVTVTP